MTKQERESMIVNKTTLYSKRDGVGYTFMGVDEDGRYKLCGMPFGYEDYIIENCFELKDNYR